MVVAKVLPDEGEILAPAWCTAVMASLSGSPEENRTMGAPASSAAGSDRGLPGQVQPRVRRDSRESFVVLDYREGFIEMMQELLPTAVLR